MFIYLITNLMNWKYYVGKTEKSVEERWQAHLVAARRNMKGHLYSAVRKYGVENFIIETLCPADGITELNELEKLWILSLRSYDQALGYNMTFGGDGGSGTAEVKAKRTKSMQRPETRKKISKAAKIRFATSKHPMIGKSHNLETRRQMGNTRISRCIKPPFEAVRKFKEFIRQPKSQSHKSAIAASWNDPGRREGQAVIARRINQRENSKLKDYVCPTCQKIFKQISRCVYAGHRKACLARKTVFILADYESR